MTNGENNAAAIALFMSVLDIPRMEATSFADAGHTTLEELAYAPLDELFEIRGMERDRILAVRERAKNYLTSRARE
ncbi:hypothetical protein [Polaromonas sp. A23]|uniref:hypothetical protein n=1 Tax=Polaromonas sp. A23 TaxID=1944133 RepID=UPI000984C6DC|nr:hypothetical protein [Polaromonas sp. A23]OOG44625.1 hypothetical protein B0B52_05770 [Polaromonas sp. A23]